MLTTLVGHLCFQSIFSHSLPWSPPHLNCCATQVESELVSSTWSLFYFLWWSSSKSLSSHTHSLFSLLPFSLTSDIHSDTWLKVKAARIDWGRAQHHWKSRESVLACKNKALYIWYLPYQSSWKKISASTVWSNPKGLLPDTLSFPIPNFQNTIKSLVNLGWACSVDQNTDHCR